LQKILIRIKNQTDISSNSIDVNTLGNTINLNPGAFKCKPAA